MAQMDSGHLRKQIVAKFPTPSLSPRCLSWELARPWDSPDQQTLWENKRPHRDRWVLGKEHRASSGAGCAVLAGWHPGQTLSLEVGLGFDKT